MLFNQNYLDFYIKPIAEILRYNILANTIRYNQAVYGEVRYCIVY